MKKLSHIITLVLAVLALPACTHDDNETNHTTGTALSITAGANTRAVDTNWQQSDAIGVYMLHTGTSSPSAGDDAPTAGFRYINQSADGPSATFAPADEANTAYFPTAKTEVDVIAYYPHGVGAGLVSALDKAITVNVSNQTNLPAIDLMTSALATGHSSESPTVALTFRHRLAKLVVDVKADASFNGGQADVTAITLQGTPSTATYDLMAQRIVGRGEVADIAIVGNKGIVIPTAAGSGVAFKVNAAGNEYMAALPADVPLEAGKVTTVTIVLSSTEVGISATIDPWGEASGSATGKLDIAPSLTDVTLPGDGELTVSTGALTGIYTYTHATGALTTKTPLYWDDLSGDIFNFAATFTPTATGTPEKDILSGNAAGVTYGSNIDFGKLGHDNAKLKVTLKAGTGYTDADMQAATLSVTGLTVASPYAISAGQEYIFKPKTFAASDVITITTALTTYTLKMSDIQVSGRALAGLEKGNIYSVELTVNKSGIGVAIDVEAWRDVNGSGNVGY